uniref:Uncharacterized protein n=1 Tax=Rhizophora mucronata TaxID=61149 RepID=A0A2P2M5N5_RHIMU
MANPGVGAKFLSVNLNKSYGQQQQQQYHHNNNQHHSSSYGSNRGRPGGGGGMVVLSRPRSSHKASGPKLSVPPPLNLPSLRKEHERFDPLGSIGGPAGGMSGSVSRPSSSGVGWTKLATVAAPEKEGPGIGGDHPVVADASNHGVDQRLLGVVNGVNSSSSSNAYVPPSARSVGHAASGTSPGYPVAEKATVLRGEDFPSLQAALPPTSGPEKKPKDDWNQKQKQVMNEELANDQESGSHYSALVDMRPRLHSKSNISNEVEENSVVNQILSGSIVSDKGGKQEDSFPLVQLNPRSDWEDDERDTGTGFSERGRDHGYSKSEAYWESDFSFPRPSVLPQKPSQNLFDRQVQRDNEAGKISSSEVAKVDIYGRDMRMSGTEGKEGNSWRASSPHSRDGSGAKEVGDDKNNIGVRLSGVNREITRENKYVSSPSRDSTQDVAGRRDLRYGQPGRQPWNNTVDSLGSQGSEWGRYGSEHEEYSRYRGGHHQNSSVSKPSFSLGGKGPAVNDPILNFGREKRSFSKNDKHYLEDPFMKDFGTTGLDGHDPFSGGLVGLVRRKKDVLKQTDFRDPVRESFEAELERVQKMQEQERRRIIEEQNRAMELARREEEERMRLAREQEERKRRLEEEAREAAWRAEQERLEALQRAEEQRIARDEEKRKILMEEERRKQAAKQKLLELEERIAKRHSGAEKVVDSNPSLVGNEKMSAVVTEEDVSRMADVGDWRDGERMVERITTLTSTDSSGMKKPSEMASGPHFSRGGSSTVSGRRKQVSSWRRDGFDNGNGSTIHPHDEENDCHSPHRDASVGSRALSRKESYGGPGFISSRDYHGGKISETITDSFRQIKGQRWDISGDGVHYNRSIDMEPEFHETFANRFGDGGWGQGHSRGNLYPAYQEHFYLNPDADGPYSLGRSRYSMRQPRVLPPPSMTSLHRTYGDNDIEYNHGARNESAMLTTFDSSNQENLGRTEIVDSRLENNENEVQKLDNKTVRCDSQSSLSVSSPPASPVHLSHDDLDESGNLPVVSGCESKDTLGGQVNESVASPTGAEKENMICGSSIVSSGDDEEWIVENDDQFQEQEEYDEDEEGYAEEDEVHDGDDENINLTQEFADMHLEDKGSPEMDNLVLGFNEGVEVGMPNDELEKNTRNEDTKYPIPHISVGAVKENASFDELHSDGKTFQSVGCPTEVGIDKSSGFFLETEKAMQGLVIQPKNTPQTSVTPNLIGHMDSSSAGLSTPPQVSMSSAVSVMSTVPSVQSQPELPVKLQFGLFSGPSLIPSPVPAIQIGSIQMPLHLHPQVGPSLTHMHPSQPLFQFGQLSYASSISQGMLPLPPQSMSFVQPNVPAKFSLNENVGSALPIQPGQDASHDLMKSNIFSASMDSQSGLLPRHGIIPKDENSLPPRDKPDSTKDMQQGQVDLSQTSDCNLRAESGAQAEDSFVKDSKALTTRDLEDQPQTMTVLTQSVAKDKDLCLLKSQGTITGGRGKRYTFTEKISGLRSSLQAPEAYRLDSSSFQRRSRRLRTEFRVRENADQKQSTGLGSSNLSRVEDRSNVSSRGTGTRSGARRVTVSNRPKQTYESDGFSSRPVGSREMDSGSRIDKGTVKESHRKSQIVSQSGEDVDASLQSGIVRVFEQPGIEAPSDGDDFIEVRSKRQMLNDRREQREKENKAKTHVSKTVRKLRPTLQTATPSVTSSNKIPAPVSGEASGKFHPGFVSTEGHGLGIIDVSAGFNTLMVSQPLPPIGTPPVKTDVQADKRSVQTSFQPIPSSGGKKLFESTKKILDNVQTSLGSWGNSQINHQVMSLTQTQLEEAMKPVQFDPHSSVGDTNNSVNEPSLPSSSILAKEKSFASTPSPINSLLAGEKIQFGAVTSPTVLPPSSRVVSHGIGPPGPSRSDVQISHTLSAADSRCSLFFEKNKHSKESSAHLEDCEAEAEAAASAVAVAAISSDEIAGNGLGTGPVSAPDSQSFGGAGVNGVPSDQQLVGQSRAEESLSVALPADLSVDTPPISFWPPLPSPQHSSGTPGTWQQHSGVDSFYGPSASFTGPFISPPGSIPGVQGPPHMVVYNHFAPVGQFAQVGLSFMGTTYIPSGKQPDWKHNPASSAGGAGEGDLGNLNMVSAQRNASIPAPIQHLAPGSPLLPVASPLAMFDVSPFQSSPDMSVQARWPHVPASPLQSLPVSMPLQQPPEGVLPIQFNHGHTVANRFPESQAPTPSDDTRNFPGAADSTVNQLPDELGLVDSSTSNHSGARGGINKSSSAIIIPDVGKTDAMHNSSVSNSGGQNTSSAFKAQPSQQKNASAQQNSNSSGYSYQRGGGVSQKNGSGGEWSHRRMGYQGRNQSLGGEKGFPPSKMKQIYVAKQTSSGTSTAS